MTTAQFAQVDPSTRQFPDAVRAVVAANLTDGSAVEGAALNATVVATSGKLRGNGFVALGDSISTASDQGSGGAGFGGSWPNMVCALSTQRFNFMGNGGVAGDNSTQILARVPAVIALGPQVVTVLAGTNDLSQGVDFSVWSANIDAIATQLRAAGIRVVLCTIPPRDVTTYLATQLTWNRWLTDYARDHGHDLIDFFGLLVEPTTGVWKTGYDSGLPPHPSQLAHLAMAQLVISQVAVAAYSPIQAQLTSGDTANLINNPMLTGTDNAPQYWVISGSTSADYTEGAVTDSDFIGRAWEVAYTSVAATGVFRQLKSFNLTTGFAVGDTMLMCAKLKVVSSSGNTPSSSSGLKFQAICQGATPNTFNPVSSIGIQAPAGLHWFKFVVPAGTTILQLSTIVGFLPVGANFTAHVGQFGLFNLTAMGLAGAF